MTAPMLTLTVPYPPVRDELLADLTPDERARVRVGVWRFRDDEPDVPRDEIEYVMVPPFQDGAIEWNEIAALPHLKVLQLTSAGFEYAEPYLPTGAVLSNGRGIHDAETAEHAVGLILAVQREIDTFARAMPKGEWLQHRTRALADSRVLIVGTGAIGSAIAARLRPFEVEITRVASSARDDADGHIHASSELADLLPDADIVVLVIPATPETTDLLSADLLAALPDGALVVNVGRGALIDQDALLAELNAGRLRAALDVMTPEPLPPEHPLWRAPGTFISPHVGGWTFATFPRTRTLLARQVRHMLAGEPVENIVVG